MEFTDGMRPGIQPRVKTKESEQIQCASTELFPLRDGVIWKRAKKVEVTCTRVLGHTGSHEHFIPTQGRLTWANTVRGADRPCGAKNPNFTDNVRCELLHHHAGMHGTHIAGELPIPVRVFVWDDQRTRVYSHDKFPENVKFVKPAHGSNVAATSNSQNTITPPQASGGVGVPDQRTDENYVTREQFALLQRDIRHLSKCMGDQAREIERLRGIVLSLTTKPTSKTRTRSDD